MTRNIVFHSADPKDPGGDIVPVSVRENSDGTHTLMMCGDMNAVVSGSVIATVCSGSVAAYLSSGSILAVLANDHVTAVISGSVSALLTGNASVFNKTPTLTTSGAHHNGDYIGTSGSPMIFPTVCQYGLGLGEILQATLIDGAAQSKTMELWLFDVPITPPADNTAWAISDADASHFIGVIPFSVYYTSSINSVASINNIHLYFKSNALNNIYGCLVLRANGTYISGDITIRIIVSRYN